VSACKPGAIGWDEKGAIIDQDKCTRCGDCTVACPTGAIRFDARPMSVEEALEEIGKDADFYGKDGGVTLSGGECLASRNFRWPCSKAAGSAASAPTSRPACMQSRRSRTRLRGGRPRHCGH
jgi:pyruvate formate lyase activating enzyme